MHNNSDGGSAFPRHRVEQHYASDSMDSDYPELRSEHPGMSLRDYFAAHAPADLICDRLAGDDHETETAEQHAERHARACYIHADAMLRARIAQSPREAMDAPSPAETMRRHIQEFGK